MFNRKELKSNAKSSLKANYWRSVVAGIVAAVSTAGGIAVTYGLNSSPAKSITELFPDTTSSQAHTLLLIILSAVGVFSLVTALFRIFVLNPLNVGSSKFFVSSKDDNQTKLGTVFHGFKSDYLGNVSTMFFRDLFTFFWSLLFVIPGVIKRYSYRMVPYILADRPELDRKEVITLSREMMNGNKMATFVMDLSFIGWHLLDAITLGVVGALFTTPYTKHTDAELYFKLKEELNK